MRAGQVATWGLLAAACRAPLDDNLSDVDRLRLVAVVSEPAEAPPGAEVTYRALVVDPSGVRDDVNVDWAHCVAPRPLDEAGPVHQDCLVNSPALVPIGVGTEVSGALPEDGCRLFGPDPPEAVAGQSAGRPVDPDVTGGYYQPVRLRVVDGAVAIDGLASTRIACGLAGAGPEASVAFAQRYRRNENPRIGALSVVVGGSERALGGEGAAPVVTAGARVVVRVRFDACGDADACGDGVCGIDEAPADCADDCEAPRGCGGAERYLTLDLATRELAERREALTVSWFTTAGAFDAPRDGLREASDTSIEGAWIAPEAMGPSTIVAVLRDDRGGVAWAVGAVEVAAP